MSFIEFLAAAALVPSGNAQPSYVFVCTAIDHELKVQQFSMYLRSDMSGSELGLAFEEGRPAFGKLDPDIRIIADRSTQITLSNSYSIKLGEIQYRFTIYGADTDSPTIRMHAGGRVDVLGYGLEGGCKKSPDEFKGQTVKITAVPQPSRDRPLGWSSLQGELRFRCYFMSEVNEVHEGAFNLGPNTTKIEIAGLKFNGTPNSMISEVENEQMVIRSFFTFGKPDPQFLGSFRMYGNTAWLDILRVKENTAEIPYGLGACNLISEETEDMK